MLRLLKPNPPPEVVAAAERLLPLFIHSLRQHRLQHGIMYGDVLAKIAKWHIKHPDAHEETILRICHLMILDSNRATRRTENRQGQIRRTNSLEIARLFRRQEPDALDDLVDVRMRLRDYLDIIEQRYGRDAVRAVSMRADGHTYEEIGQAIGKSADATRKLLAKINRMMRNKLTRTGETT